MSTLGLRTRVDFTDGAVRKEGLSCPLNESQSVEHSLPISVDKTTGSDDWHTETYPVKQTVLRRDFPSVLETRYQVHDHPLSPRMSGTLFTTLRQTPVLHRPVRSRTQERTGPVLRPPGSDQGRRRPRRLYGRVLYPDVGSLPRGSQT